MNGLKSFFNHYILPVRQAIILVTTTKTHLTVSNYALTLPLRGTHKLPHWRFIHFPFLWVSPGRLILPSGATGRSSGLHSLACKRATCLFPWLMWDRPSCICWDSVRRLKCRCSSVQSLHLKKSETSIVLQGQVALHMIALKDLRQDTSLFSFFFHHWWRPGYKIKTSFPGDHRQPSPSFAVWRRLSLFSLCHFWHSPGFCACECVCASAALLWWHPWGSIGISATRQKPDTHDKASSARAVLGPRWSLRHAAVWDGSESPLKRIRIYDVWVYWCVGINNGMLLTLFDFCEADRSCVCGNVGQTLRTAAFEKQLKTFGSRKLLETATLIVVA